MSDNTPNEDDLREEAKERMDEMPAETALGNADPAGGSDESPEDYEAEYGHEGGS